MTALREVAPGIHHWTVRHPEWHPSEGDGFGARVGCYALTTAEGDLLLVDPLVPDADDGGDDDGPLAALDALAGPARGTTIFITIGYHVRSAALLAERYDATVHGPPQAGERLKGGRFALLAPEDGHGPHGVTAHAIGRPRRGEIPLFFPTHSALAFGDAVVRTPDSELRMWCQDHDDAKRRAFYRERFAPTLAPLAGLAVDHVLVTHGVPVIGDGADALRAAIAAEPWFHEG